MQTYNFFRNIGIKLLMSVCLFLTIGTHSALKAQISISELMIDPSPSVGLPNTEYIELHNISTQDIQLSNWELQIGKSKKLLPDSVLRANDYIIITDFNFITEFKTRNTIGIASFPSLSNTGSVILLRNNIGAIVCAVQYDESWFKDTKKKQGGWALEMIDAEKACETSIENYCFSENTSGGTPGYQNSVSKQKNDFEGLKATACFVICDTQVVISFNKPLDSNQLSTTSNYRLIERNQQVKVADYSCLSPTSIKLTFAQNFKHGIIEHLKINLQDCNTNQKQSFIIPVTLPDSIQKDDIIINEVLFDVIREGTEFIELYNTSNKTLAINDLYISTQFDSIGNVKQTTPLAKNGILLFPGEYRAFTRDTLALQQILPASSVGLLSQTSVPQLNNENGHVAICNKNNQIINQLLYSKDMHYPLLKTCKGVSIERINVLNKSDDRENWHSASSSCGYATPGRVNSQTLDSSITDKLVILSPECISPDNDGINDFGQIEISVSKPGYVASILIFDLNGTKIRQLTQNMLISSPYDAIIWDATDNNNSLVPNAAYICTITLIHPDGSQLSYKLPWYVGKKI